MAFDGIVTKLISDELQSLSGSRIDKIFQTSKNEIVLGLYLDGKNYALNISIDSQYYRINLSTHSKPNPQIAPNFCMLLRKHLIGLKLKNVITSNLERIVTLEIEGFDDYEDIVCKKLIIELMGKHGNIILVDESNIIIDCLRHIKSTNENNRNLLPHCKYTLPNNSKINFFDIKNFDEFRSKLPDDLEVYNIPQAISNTYNGISKSFIENILNKINSDNLSNNLENIYNYINVIIGNSTSSNVHFEINNNNYFLCPESTNNSSFNLNFFIDDYYFKKETEANFKAYRNNTLKLILEILNKYKARLNNINKKLKECENMDKYKLYGELLTANLYKFDNKNLEKVEVENYYENNSLITISLDKRYTPSDNATKFFKKYNKLKNTLEIVGKQKLETMKELNYLESVVYELESSSTTEDITQIFDEINDILKPKQKNPKIKKTRLTKNKEVSFNPIKYTFDGYTVFVGRNNKENDYLTLKFANKKDFWFHTKDIHGSHVILKTNDKPINDDILYRCAKLAAKHSKAKNSSNVPVDYCLVKCVKKPNGAKPGMVIYENNKTIFVK